MLFLARWLWHGLEAVTLNNGPTCLKIDSMTPVGSSARVKFGLLLELSMSSAARRTSSDLVLRGKMR
jgi:hypothetical protein